jgi:phage gpG-like protein
LSTQQGQWNSSAIVAAAALELQKRMERAAILVEATAVKKVSTGQGVRRTKGGHLVGLNPSTPGQPPHVLSGQLRQSITHEVENTGTQIVARVGSNKKYARRLELGFTGRDTKGRNYKQAPRPYLRPSVSENKSTIDAILKGKQ